MTPAQLDALRRALPPFAEEGAAPPALGSFCRFYGIDFAERQSQLDYRAGTVRSGAYSLVAHRWQQPAATANLLIVHGYLDHAGLFGKLAAWALTQNFNVVAFDLPGHGLSSGEPAVIDDFREYSRAIAAVLAAVALPSLPLWVMAQSTGGAALIDYARSNSWPFAATVLLAPLVRPAGWRAVSLAQRVLSPFAESVPRKFNDNSSDREFLDFVRADPLQSQRISLRWIGALRRWLAALPRANLGVGPALVIQGEKDHTVDWRYNMGFIDALFPGSRIEYLHGAGHQLANESGPIRQDYLARVSDYLASKGLRPRQS